MVYSRNLNLIMMVAKKSHLRWSAVVQELHFIIGIWSAIIFCTDNHVCFASRCLVERMLAHTIVFLIRVSYRRRQRHIVIQLSGGYCALCCRFEELETSNLEFGHLTIFCNRRLGKLSEQPHVGFAIKQVVHLYASPINGSVEVGVALACCVVQVVLALSILGVALCYGGVGYNM